MEYSPDEFANGLSLCIQGTLNQQIIDEVLPRFIPVYTGNTYFRRGRAIAGAVYPCVYREHAIVPQPPPEP